MSFKIHNDKNICIIGLGYVGLTLALTLAKKKFKVYGVEINKEIIDNLKKNSATFFEPKINKIIRETVKKKKFIFSEKIEKNWKPNVYIITVGTPLGKNKKPRFDIIKNVEKILPKYIKRNNLIILRSTVKVGTSRKFFQNLSKKINKKFDLGYCPERTAEGNALNEIKNLPQIISGINKSSEIRSKNIFSKITNQIILASNLETAELCKVVDNTQRDTFFSFSNEIANVCDELNLSATEVIKTCNYKYPRSNLFFHGPVAGPCLSKDAYIYKESAMQKNYFPKIAITARKTNEKIIYRSLNFIKKKLNKKSKNSLKVAILGLAFKGHPKTNDTRDSVSNKIINELKKITKTENIYCYDKLVKKDFFNFHRVHQVNNQNKIFENKDLVIFLNNNKDFNKINLNKMSKKMNSKSIIYDFWSLFLNKKKLSNGVRYYAYGNHNI